MSDYPVKRDLDGVYFRVKRHGRYQTICWSDLTDDEREMLGSDRPLEWWKSMTGIMTKQLRLVGDELGIVMDYGEDD